MDLRVFKSFEELSLVAKDIIIQEIVRKKDLLLCTATGSSPTRTYELLCNEYENNPSLFSLLRIIKLDEWGGIPMEQSATCEYYLKNHLLQALKIPPHRYIGFNSHSDDPELECARIQDKLNHQGSIDICILGLGMNGHLALNEPADFLQPYCHQAELSQMSLNHPMISFMENKPSYGLTLGMTNILNSRMILLLVNGTHKKEIVNKFLSKKITTYLPASFLWLHPNVICLIEQNAINDPL